MGNVLQLSSITGVSYFMPHTNSYASKIPEFENSTLVKVKVEEYEFQIQQFWHWMTALVITDLGIACKLHILNPRWPHGTYFPSSRGWSRSQLGAQHYKNHNHRLCAFVYDEQRILEDAGLQLEWNAFVNCYC